MIIYLAFDSEYVMPKDFSITIWSDKDAVEINHTEGLKSETWGNLDYLDPAVDIPKNFKNSKSDQKTD